MKQQPAVSKDELKFLFHAETLKCEILWNYNHEKRFGSDFVRFHPFLASPAARDNFEFAGKRFPLSEVFLSLIFLAKSDRNLFRHSQIWLDTRWNRAKSPSKYFNFQLRRCCVFQPILSLLSSWLLAELLLPHVIFWLELEILLNAWRISQTYFSGNMTIFWLLR